MAAVLDELKQKVAMSCRILAMEGLVEGILGHVSARVAESDEMLIRCRGEDEQGVFFTSAEAIRRVNLDGQGSDLAGRYEVPKELPIHGEIYKVRPDVSCVIHAHPHAALICAITDLDLRPIFGAFNIPAMRMALEGIPVFPRSVLISTPELAAAMIELMGQKDICLLRGHGVTVTGRTVEEATVRALGLNTLARVTLHVAQSGRQANDISPQDRETFPDLGPTFNTTWAWRYYVRLVEACTIPRHYWL
jgi:ribulose-5-phosphate 4-epimerase/fuculose-1-phosphate aldolase